MNRIRIAARSLVLIMSAFVAVSCGPEKKAAPADQSKVAIAPPAATQPIDPPGATASKPVDLPGIHNVVAFSDGIYSGGVPEGLEGFATLKAMGIKTILSVDGSQPEVESATLYGMRYVHLPIGYNGMSQDRQFEIARVVQDLPHPIYIHCHHGKHRSACATGAALVTLGLLAPDEAVARMKVSGTSPKYTGLYKVVQSSSSENKAKLASASNAFPEHWKTTGFVQTMVEVDAANDHLKAVEKAGWKTPANHPDLVPAAEAGRLADLLRNAPSTSGAKTWPEEFKTMMAANAALAADLEESLVAGNVPADQLSAKFKLVGQSCVDCHVKFRDKP